VLLHAEARKTIKCVLREVKRDEPPTAAAGSKAAHPKPAHKDEDAQKAQKQKTNNGGQ
jgi:ribosomal protein L12E/L44/L45/RPP1/RPP2